MTPSGRNIGAARRAPRAARRPWSTLARCASVAAAIASAAIFTAPPVARAADAAAGAADASPRGTLPLDAVLARVFERNPTLDAARAAWREAGAQARMSGALDEPMVDVMVAPRTFGRSDEEAGYRLGITQPLPLFGQRGAQRRGAERERDAMAEDLAALKLDLAHEARVTYVEYWRTTRAADANRELAALLTQLRGVALAKYAAGLVSQQDPLEADAEMAMVDHTAVMLERQRRLAVARLNLLMHDAPDRVLPPPAELALPDTTSMSADLTARARALRPELRAADARVGASEAGVDAARRARLPETSVSAGYDRMWSDAAMRPSVGIAFSVPLQVGRLDAAADAARAGLARREAERATARDSIALQVVEAEARFHEQAHDLAITRERLVPLAERALAATRASYEANRTEFAALLGAARDLLRARLAADESLAALQVARADLDRAVGEVPAQVPQEGTR
jgi:cobalt-zinc-cadmium efflux system outer membrane protein